MSASLTTAQLKRIEEAIVSASLEEITWAGESGICIDVSVGCLGDERLRIIMDEEEKIYAIASEKSGWSGDRGYMYIYKYTEKEIPKMVEDFINLLLKNYNQEKMAKEIEKVNKEYDRLWNEAIENGWV